MAEQKTKPAAKKAAPGKTGSVAAVKPKAAKVTATTATKKVATKKTAAPAAKKAAAPVAKKAAAPVADKKTPVKKAATASSKPAAKKMMAKPTPEERYRMVQTAAYFIAERNGFSGCSADHWVAAELEIAGKLDR